MFNSCTRDEVDKKSRKEVVLDMYESVVVLYRGLGNVITYLMNFTIRFTIPFTILGSRTQCLPIHPIGNPRRASFDSSGVAN